MTNILFVCQANVGRSQSAAELYKLKTHNAGRVASAGTKVDTPGATLAQRPGAANIVQIMREDHGVDMINNVRTQISPENAKGFDKIIVMAERDTIPEWLLADKRAILWTVPDPKGQDMETTRRIVRKIEELVGQLD